MAVGHERRQERLDGFFGLAPPRAQPHERRVHHDAMEPGRDLRGALELPDRAERTEVGRLNDVARVLFVSHEPARGGEHTRAKYPHQRFERPLLAIPESLDEDGVVNRGRRLRLARKVFAHTNLVTSRGSRHYLPERLNGVPFALYSKETLQ